MTRRQRPGRLRGGATSPGEVGLRGPVARRRDLAGRRQPGGNRAVSDRPGNFHRVAAPAALWVAKEAMERNQCRRIAGMAAARWAAIASGEAEFAAPNAPAGLPLPGGRRVSHAGDGPHARGASTGSTTTPPAAAPAGSWSYPGRRIRAMTGIARAGKPRGGCGREHREARGQLPAVSVRPGTSR